MLLVAVDGDDDDDDGVIDGAQTRAIPPDDLVVIPRALLEPEHSQAGPFRLSVEGAIRLIRGGVPVPTPTVVAQPGDLEALRVQGLADGGATAAVAPVLIVQTGGDRPRRVPVRLVQVRFLDGDNRPLVPSEDAVGVSHHITNDRTLPRQPSYAERSGDHLNLRVEIRDPQSPTEDGQIVVESLDPRSGAIRSTRRFAASRPRPELGLRSPFFRLVADEMDEEAPGVGHLVLRVALRDRLRVRYSTTAGIVSQDIRVARPGREDGELAARQATLRVRILRDARNGRPVVGQHDGEALAIGRRQVAIANAVWLQCAVGFGDAHAADVAVVDAPTPALVAVGEGDGLPAAGGGELRMRISGRPLRPVTTSAGASPTETALALADAVETLGFRARVTTNVSTEFGAGESADLVVTDRDGTPVAITADGASPLSTDLQQSVTIGSVDLTDGLGEFDNMNAATGSLEERTLLKLLGDDDPTTIDLFIVNGFSGGTRQGEAFIEADGGAIVNALILDRNGIRQQQEAWTQAHELGHVLLNHPYHPDNVGPDRPWLLMDADSSLGLVTGPKRLDPAECARARAQSGVDALPVLLRRAPEPSLGDRGTGGAAPRPPLP